VEEKANDHDTLKNRSNHGYPSGPVGMGVQAQSKTQYFVTLGAGVSQYTDPHSTMTGSFGARITDGLYAVTSLDMGSRLDPEAKARRPVSTIRTGVEKVIAQQGLLTLSVHGDAGLQAGPGNLTSAFSGGGTISALLPSKLKLPPGTFAFGSVRILNRPATISQVDQATVQMAFTFGIGFAFGGM
jgi:hypothetical protein